MQCPVCAYMMSSFDKECPRCHGRGWGTPPPLSKAATASHLAQIAGATKPVFHSFLPLSLWSRVGPYVGWSLTAILMLWSILVLAQGKVGIFFLLILLAMVVSIAAVITSIDRTRPNQMVNTLAAAANSTRAYVDHAGKGISINTATRQVVTSRQQKNGFWIQSFPVQSLNFQISVHRNASAVQSFSSGPTNGEENLTYLLHLQTPDFEYPEHTIDFGNDKAKVERYDAQIRSLLD